MPVLFRFPLSATSMRRAAALASVLALVGVGPASWAQTGAIDAFRALGEKPGLVALMDDFVPRLFQDPRTARFFKSTNQRHLKEQLVDQVCAVLGGPCAYEGAPMKEAHSDLGITKADFLALVDILQDTMDARGVPFAVQNRLLAQLAPMHRDIVEARP